MHTPEEGVFEIDVRAMSRTCSRYLVVCSQTIDNVRPCERGRERFSGLGLTKVNQTSDEEWVPPAISTYYSLPLRCRPERDHTQGDTPDETDTI